MESRSGSGATPAANSVTHLSKTVSYICGGESHLGQSWHFCILILDDGNSILIEFLFNFVNILRNIDMLSCAMISLFFLKLTDLMHTKSDYVHFYLPVPFLSAA
ncbi:uncharacterized protein DC041_0004094 [Schistosoma bovis]|uniref:Uncharacterized protein n=1 Tax=Schistosoma bovis TaxID=6184 RepID=A0A430Q6W9_SCHBO|nr:uncharacterized protein DC041_0004094 [Schistosoma bovis]